MASSYDIALSGMRYNETRLAVSANNVANMATTGKVDDPTSGYKAQQVSGVAQADGGVVADVQDSSPAQVQAYSPNDPNANAEGLVNLPNVDLTQETVNQMMAVTGYKANASVVRTLAAMDKSLLDIKV